MALSKIGNERSQLTDFDTDTGKIKDQCALHYEQTLHEVIRTHTWNCCKERAKLVSTGNTPTFGWSYEFTIPSDCIRSMFLTNTDDTGRMLKTNIEWAVDGTVIVSNHSEVWLLYIKEPTPEAMDPLFAQAFYTLLASKLSIPIGNSQGGYQLHQQLLNEYLNVIMPEARRVNGFEGKENPVVDSDWLEATYTSPSLVGQSWPPFGSATWTTDFPWT